MLENVFSQLGFESEDKKQQKVAAELLYKVVAPLQASDEQYPAQIFDYIWSGQHPEILMTLQSRQNDDVAILLGQPATLNWWSVSPSSQFLAQNNKKLIRPLAKVNLRASNSPFQQLNSFLDQSVSVYFYSVLLISENV